MRVRGPSLWVGHCSWPPCPMAQSVDFLSAPFHAKGEGGLVDGSVPLDDFTQSKETFQFTFSLSELVVE